MISSAAERMRETEALIARAHQIVDLTKRRVRVPGSDDPYVEWVQERKPRRDLASELTRAMAEEVGARIAVSEQLVALARRLIRASRERRAQARKRPPVPPFSAESTHL